MIEMQEAKIQTTVNLPVDLYYAMKARIENFSAWVVEKLEGELEDNLAVLEAKIHRLQDELAMTQATYEHIKKGSLDRNQAVDSAMKVFKSNLHNDRFNPDVWARNQSQILREDYAVKISPAELLEIAEKRFIQPETEQQESTSVSSQGVEKPKAKPSEREDSKEGV